MRVKIHPEHWLGKLTAKINGGGDWAITLGRYVFLSCPLSEFGPVHRNHERIHMCQRMVEGVWKFRARYLWQLLTRGYRGIDYEVEAYTNEGDLTYCERRWPEVKTEGL